MKKQNLFSTFLVSTVVLSIALPGLVHADPTGTPPGGNVDATFNSVTAGYGTTAPYIGGNFQGDSNGINAVSTGPGSIAGGFYGPGGIDVTATDAAQSAALFINNGSGFGVRIADSIDAFLATGPINLVGRIYSGSTNINDKYINIEDSDGVRFGNDAGTFALQIAGTGELSNPSVAATGAVKVKDDQGFQLWSSAGINPNLSIVPTGPLTTASTSGNLSLNLSSGNGTVFFLDNLGNTATSINRWGLWSNTAGQPLKIIDSDGLGIGDNAGNVRLLIDDTGDITNVSGTNPVKISDDQGIQFANNAGAVGLTVSGTGAISNTDAGVIIDDDDMNTACTNVGKAAYIDAGGVTHCKKPVSIATAGLDLAGTLTNTISGMPVMISDTEGVWFSGANDGSFVIQPDGTSGVSIGNENGDKVLFNHADDIIVGPAATGLQIAANGDITKLGAGAVNILDGNGLTVNGNVGIGNTAPTSKLDVTGHIKATSIGAYYSRFSNDASRTSGAWVGCDSTTTGGNSCNLKATCDPGDISVDTYISWLHNADSNGHVEFIYNSGTSGSVYFYDTGNKPDDFMVGVRCFSPNT